MSARLLLEEFGGWGGVPSRLCAPIIELSCHRLADEATKRRFKWLCHLPQACTFMVAELDLSGLVSKRVLHSAAEQISRSPPLSLKLERSGLIS